MIRGIEPTPRPRRSIVSRKALELARRIARARHDEYFELPESVGRDTFVEACRRVLRGLDREVLVVGLGKRRGVERRRPSSVTHAWVAVGERSKVAFTPRGLSLVRAHVSTVPRSESIIVHNHPREGWRSLLSEIIGWSPLPSLTDRQEAGRRHGESIREFLSHYHDGFYRFYLVDQGEAEEFVLPPLETCLGKLRALSSASPTESLPWLLGVLRQAPW